MESIIQVNHTDEEFLKIIKKDLLEEQDIHFDNEFLLKLAIWNCHMKSVRFLVNHGADVRVENDTLIEKAIERRCLEAVEVLLEKDETIINDNPNLLQLAIRFKDLSIVKCLVDRGADISINQYENFLIAIDDNNVEIVEYFVKQGLVCTDSFNNHINAYIKRSEEIAGNMYKLVNSSYMHDNTIYDSVLDTYDRMKKISELLKKQQTNLRD